MYPAAEDNYGYDACAVLCLPCVPNILVIATETGTLYHCVVLEAEEEDESGVSTGQSNPSNRISHSLLIDFKMLLPVQLVFGYLEKLYTVGAIII